MAIEDTLSGAGIPYPLARSIIFGLANSTTDVRISAHGVPGPLAIELARQINAKTINVPNLMALGMPGAAAQAIAASASGGVASVFRGFNAGMGVGAGSAMITGTARSYMVGIQRKFPFPIRRLRVRQHVFSAASAGNNTDTLYANPTRFAHAFTPSGRLTFTGIPQRTAVAMWEAGAKNYMDFDPATWDTAIGSKASEIVDLGVMTDTVDHWMCVVAPPSVASPNAHFVPTEFSGENLIPHGLGYKFGTTDFIADGNFITDTTLTAFPSSGGGSAQMISPAMFEIEVPATGEWVAVLHDSHGVGANAGAGATVVDSVQYGGPMGDTNLSVSWADKGLAAQGVGFCRFGKGGDGDIHWVDPNNWRYRKQLAIAANPTRIANIDGTNTLGQATSTIANNNTTTFARGDSVRHVLATPVAAANNVYLCTKAGTSTTGMPEALSSDVFGTVVVSGTAEFVCMGAYTAPLYGAVATIGKNLIVSDQIKAQWPTLPYIRAGVLPNPSTSDGMVTPENQTPSAVFGVGPTSKRGIYLTLLLTPLVKALLRYDYLWRQDLLIENDPANFDGKVKVDPLPNRRMFAGHLTSPGHSEAAPAVTAASVGK